MSAKRLATFAAGTAFAAALTLVESASRRMAPICSSLNLLFLIVAPSLGAGLPGIGGPQNPGQ